MLCRSVCVTTISMDVYFDTLNMQVIVFIEYAPVMFIDPVMGIFLFVAGIFNLFSIPLYHPLL